jgi:sulfatase maturation enzyme AslB (radical SAM superfamily)
VNLSQSTFSAFLPEHAERLALLAQTDSWRAALADEDRLRRLRETTLKAPAMPDPAALLKDTLVGLNGARIRQRIADGERDIDRLAWDLGQWPQRWDGPPPPLSFVGIYLTLACDARPKCVYCNQRPVADCLPIAEWRKLVEELIAGEGPKPYFSYTGGEPLICGEELYGPEGLIRLAAEAGAPSNVNTNALELTPEAALSLVHAGTARLHISLDSASPEVQDRLAGTSGRFAQYVEGIYNLQIAREVLGVDHPVVHINCVLTTENLFSYPGLVRFLLERKRVRTPGAESAWRGDPHYRDLGIHLIPVGGRENDSIRPTADEWERFLTDTWEQAAGVWNEYQEARGIPEDQRIGYDDYAFFANPYKRVKYAGTLRDYAEAAAKGVQSTLGLGKRCLVVPTQAFFLPDGAQHWCGGHAVTRPEPMGHRGEGAVAGNIERALPRLADLPTDACRGCPVATIFLNQGAEAALRAQVEKWIEEQGEARSDES